MIKFNTGYESKILNHEITLIPYSVLLPLLTHSK